jgi:transcription elongation GreA/GreB family factor
MLTGILGGGLPSDQSEVLYLTLAGKRELEAELACLEQMREQTLAEQQTLPVHKAQGPEMVVKSAELAALDREIARLRMALARAIVQANAAPVIGVGSRVRVTDEHGGETMVSIVGPLASNPHRGRVWYESALGHSLLGHTSGATVVVRYLGQARRVRITSVEGPNRRCDERPEHNLS